MLRSLDAVARTPPHHPRFNVRGHPVVGEVLEVSGPSGAGKTEILYSTVLNTVLPAVARLWHNVRAITYGVIGGLCDAVSRYSNATAFHLVETSEAPSS